MTARTRFASPADGPDAAERHAGRGVLELAHEIRLDRRWTPAELQRANESTDTRILAAVGQSDRFGIGEYLAAGPQLLAMATNAWDPEGGHTRGAALIAAAIDARRAGWYGPVPESVLEKLHRPYLAARGGMILRPETWEAALTWATTPVFAVSSLLVPDQEGSGRYRVFDYLADAGEAEPVPEATWTTLIDEADAPTCLDIGWEAYHPGGDGIAHRAFRKALDGGVLLAAEALAWLLSRRQNQRDIRRAADLIRQTLDGAPPDADRADLLVLRSALSWWTGANGNTDEALATSREILADSRELFGDDHEATIAAALRFARWTGHAGEPATAFRLAGETCDRATRVFGPDQLTTLSARFESAAWADHDGDTGRAVRLWEALDDDATRLMGEFSNLTNDTRWNLAEAMIQSGDVDGGLRVLRSVVEGRAVMFGEEHPRTIAGRLQLAGETGTAGRFAEALATVEGVRRDTSRIFGDDHELTLFARYQVALWTAKTGAPESAESLFTELLADTIRAVGTDHPMTGDVRDQLGRAPGYTDRYPLPRSW